jgi:hypothetical protein
MSIEYHFDATADEVFELLTDADFLVDRCLALGELSADCTIEANDRETVITMSREVERKLPSFLARIFDNRQNVEMVERWRSSGKTRKGSYSLTVLGQPVKVSAEITLKPDRAGGCTYTITHTAKANLPLIAGRVESYILSQTEKGARDELDYLAESLGS